PGLVAPSAGVMALPPRDGCDWSSSAIGAPSRPVPQESVSADECDPGPTGCQANTRWFSCCGTCRGSAEHPAVNLLGRPLPCEDGTVFPRGSLQAAPDVVRGRSYRFAGKQSFNIGGLKCHEARRSMTSRFTPLPRVLAPRPLWWCEASRRPTTP